MLLWDPRLVTLWVRSDITVLMEDRHTQQQTRLRGLYEAHYAAVLAYACRRAPRSAAEDVAHETFLVAWRKLDDVPAEALPWLLGVARRVLANDRRGADRRQALIDRLAATSPTSASAVNPDDASVSPQLREALEALSALELEALLLTAWEELSPSDAARVLGCSRVTFRARLYRARRTLTAALAGPRDRHIAPPTSSLTQGVLNDAQE
jgi:RNA polymerase sigma factor (sigma-70 family)